MLQRGHSCGGCDLASTLCKYDLRKGDLFVLSRASVRRVCIWRMFVFMSVCCGDYVGVCGNVCCVVAVVEASIFSPGVLKYVGIGDVMDVVFLFEL